MKKIVHIILTGYVEGCAYQENILPRKHKELGYDVMILVSKFSRQMKGRDYFERETGTYINNDGISVCVLDKSKGFIKSRILRYKTSGLYEKLCEYRPDIIFLHEVKYSENRDVVKFVIENPEVILYADSHIDYYNSPENTLKQKIAGCLSKYNAKQLDKITKVFWGTTPWRVEHLKDYFGLSKEKCRLLIMGGDESQISAINKDEVRKEIRSKYNIPQDAFLVITGGIIDKRKHQELLMEAVSRLESKRVWLIVFGTPDDDMKGVCDYYSSKNNIVFTGWVEASFSNELMLASDLAVFPGTHSVLWEQAATCGLPQLIRHWSGMEHINVNGNAILLDDVTIETIENEIKKCINKDYYKEFKMKAEEAAPNFYYIEIAKKSIEL